MRFGAIKPIFIIEFLFFLYFNIKVFRRRLVLSEKKDFYKEELQKNGMTIITKEDGLDVDAFKAGVDALKAERYPQYAEYFAFINDYLTNY